MPKLALAKGYVECALSRAMVEFMIKDLNLDPLLDLMRGRNKEFGREMLIPTLHSTDALQAPGGFTHRCLDMGKRVQHVTRHVNSATIFDNYRKSLCLNKSSLLYYRYR